MSTIQNSQDDLEIREYPIGTWGQLLLAAWSLLLILGFAMAIYLAPHPSGSGTHQQLGLPPCTMKVVMGIPCPSCGMTTSFSNFVRGNFVAAYSANPAGLLLATICVLIIPWCWVSIARRHLWKIENPDRAVLILMILICSSSLLQWAVRLLI
ncbi:hypothetical protein Pla110_34490 [Polystyrenella longa]|uniref:DUF2752 domain-containing protein n=1 Tax=Polystyrenella longa TaxID=2528007 RepID=A0A518CR77_9PLAN|nr:DUF2752 domain-containing protein [Polystyrenella longa]QDU81704.1 hypothetical protein Pla110_34490 [Polystyrenella longa]